MNKSFKIGIIIAIAFQILVLIWMLISAHLPLWLGQEMKVSVEPIDPRSMFRGNYAQVNYNFNEITLKKGDALFGKSLRIGEKLYLSFAEGKNGVYEYNSVHLLPPKEGRYLKARLQYQFLRRNDEKNERKITLRVANIDAYFAPKEKALELEKRFREGDAIAVLSVWNGRARIREILPQIKEN